MSDQYRQDRERGEAEKREQAQQQAADVETTRQQSGEMLGSSLDGGTDYPPVPRRENVPNKNGSSYKRFGAISIAAFFIFMLVFFMIPSQSVDTSDAAVKALAERSSTSLLAGAVLLKEDKNIGKQDYTIAHKSASADTKIWVWDYAAEDGDYVQVLVNGAPVGDAFMIKHKPRVLTVPAVGEVQVKGVKDGGGGITYAIRYDVNGTNYFNSAPQGEFNTYTLQEE